MWKGSKQFILSYFLTGFITLLEKTNGFQTNTRLDNTEYALTTNSACLFLQHFLFIRRSERLVYCFYSKANYHENYHLMARQTLM